MAEVMDLEALQAKWQALFRPFAVDSRLAAELFADLVAHYQEDGRYYHTLPHVQDVLATIDSVKSHAQNLVAIQLAAWFHDVIYDARATGDNEARSADYAEQALQRLDLPAGLVATVKRFILATKHHQAAADDIDCQILLDADLASFAGTPEEHARYSQAIRQEFAFVPELVYRQARIDILNHFLQRDRIYLTDFLFEKLEKRARQNIEEEIASLRKMDS